MSRLNSSILALAALLLVGASMALNWSFWTAQATSALAAQIFGAVSLAIDAFKAGLPFVIRKAASGKQRKAAALATTLFLGCLIFSFLNALGFASMNRGQAAASHADLMQRYDAAASELKDLQSRISAESTARSPSLVEEAIAKAKQDRHWSSSSNCTDVTIEASRSFCQTLSDLNLELAEDKDHDTLRARADQLESEIATLAKAGNPRETDAQENLIAKLSGLDVTEVQTALSLLFALLVEFGAAFGLFLAALPAEREPPAAEMAQPAARIVHPRRQLRSEGGRLMITQRRPS